MGDFYKLADNTPLNRAVDAAARAANEAALTAPLPLPPHYIARADMAWIVNATATHEQVAGPFATSGEAEAAMRAANGITEADYQAFIAAWHDACEALTLDTPCAT